MRLSCPNLLAFDQGKLAGEYCGHLVVELALVLVKLVAALRVVFVEEAYEVSGSD